MKRTIYLDHAATTQPFPKVLEAMLPYYSTKYGNPSSAYELGEESRKAVEKARKIIASTLHTNEKNIYFTSGGTESDNWALRMAVNQAQKTGAKAHIITSAIEHPAILKTCQRLREEGVEVSTISVDSEGIVNLKELEQEIRPETALISIMYANNEIGTIEPVAKIGAIAKRYHIPFHCDAVQAYGQIPLHPEQVGIDFLSASGHKFYGPKGTGFLYVGPGVKPDPMIFGGSQEGHMRAGTENVPGIVGLGKAAQMAHATMGQTINREIRLRNYFIARLLREIPRVKINGCMEARLPGNVNVCIEGINGGALVALLDLEGICASAASACSTGSDQPSHVQLAIGNSVQQAHSAIRFSLGRASTMEEIDEVMMILNPLVKKLRSMEEPGGV